MSNDNSGPSDVAKIAHRTIGSIFSEGNRVVQRHLREITERARAVWPSDIPFPEDLFSVNELCEDLSAMTEYVRDRVTLRMLLFELTRRGLPLPQLVCHDSRSITGEEKELFFLNDREHYQDSLDQLRQPDASIVVVKTMLLQTEEGLVLFCASSQTSFDTYRRAIGDVLLLSGKQAKSIRPYQGDLQSMIGLERGASSPFIEPGYLKNIQGIFLHDGSFSVDAVVEVPLNLRFGLMLNAAFLKQCLCSWLWYPPVTLLF